MKLSPKIPLKTLADFKNCVHSWLELLNSHNDEPAGSWRCRKCGKQVWKNPLNN